MSKKRGVQWRQFSLRLLFTAIFAVALGLAIIMAKARGQRAAVAGFEENNGRIEYEVRSPPWFARLVGRDYLDRVLKVNFGAAQINGDALADLSQVPHIQELDLGGTNIGDNAVRHVGSLRNLRTLNLCGTEVTDDGLSVLSSLGRLKKLDLRETRAGDGAIEAASACMNLDTLLLSQTNVTDAGVAHLLTLPKLRVLVLDSTSVSDESLKFLRQMSTLAVLSIVGTKITPHGVGELKSNLRQTEILSWY